ncbi:MAG: anti-sigma factor antagonist [Planctomycetota bacterium]|nr:MAG: anti-sigma factor antagonist [Planctomycetota bacterium]
MPDLKLHQEMLPAGICYIEAEGFLDAHTFEEMENLISSVFRQNCFKIIVKLEKLDYISSAGAGVFVGAIGRAKDNGGDIVFLKPSANVKEVFDLLGLSAIFQFAESREQAESCF